MAKSDLNDAREPTTYAHFAISYKTRGMVKAIDTIAKTTPNPRASTRTRAFLLASKGECPQRAHSASQMILLRKAFRIATLAATALALAYFGLNQTTGDIAAGLVIFASFELTMVWASVWPAPQDNQPERMTY